MKQVYLDNAATTPVRLEVEVAMRPYFCEKYGNPSGVYQMSSENRGMIENVREQIAKTLNASAEEIYFTSGGTESDNWAIKAAAQMLKEKGRHIITSKIEHHAILNSCAYLEKQGFEVTYLPVDEKGCIRLEDLQRAITGETILVSIMYTNNEVGSQQPIAQAGALIKKMNPQILFHVDAVQGFGKARIYPKRMNIDMLSVSGHKIHGPKGVGFLYVDSHVKLKPIIFGGGQQGGMRSGTENVPGIAGIAKAAQIMYDNYDQDIEKLYDLKKCFIEGVKKIDRVIVNGPDCMDGAPHIVSVSFSGVRSEVLLHSLEDKGIYVSAGSACSAHKPQPSATLMAMGVPKDLLSSTIRFSFSVFTTMEEINYTLEALYDIIPMLRKYTRK